MSFSDTERRRSPPWDSFRAPCAPGHGFSRGRVWAIRVIHTPSSPSAQLADANCQHGTGRCIRLGAHRVVRAASSRRQAVVAMRTPATSFAPPHYAALAVERPRQGDAAPHGECVPASGELVQTRQNAFAQRRLQQLQHVGRHARPPDRQLAAVTCPQLPQRLAAPSQHLRAAHIRALGRSRNPFRLPARLTPQSLRVGRPEDVALPGSDLAEDTTRQARLGLHQEVHGIMRQVIVVARTMPRGQPRSPLSDDRHQVAAPGHLGERHVHKRHRNHATRGRHTGFPTPAIPVAPSDGYQGSPLGLPQDRLRGQRRAASSRDRLLRRSFRAGVNLHIPKSEAVRGVPWVTAGDRSFPPFRHRMWHGCGHPWRIPAHGSGWRYLECG